MDNDNVESFEDREGVGCKRKCNWIKDEGIEDFMCTSKGRGKVIKS